MAGDVTREITIPIEVEGVEEAEQDLDKVTESTEDLNEELDDSIDNFKFMGVSLGGLKKGFIGITSGIKAATTGTRIFGTALKATGIGLLVAVLAAEEVASGSLRQLYLPVSDRREIPLQVRGGQGLLLRPGRWDSLQLLRPRTADG